MNKHSLALVVVSFLGVQTVAAPPEELPIPPLKSSGASPHPQDASLPPPGNRTARPAPTRRHESPRARLEALLEAAQQERELLHEDVRRASLRPPVMHNGLDNVRQDLRETEQEQAENLRTLQSKLLELDAALGLEHEADAEDVFDGSDVGEEANPLRAEPSPLMESPPAQGTTQETTIPTGSGHQHGEQGEAEESPCHAAVDAPPTAVMPEAVDRLRLADSLFAQSQWQQALAIYQAAAKEQKSAEDRTWVEYQQANCHRHLGQLDQAEKFYRMVAGAEGDLLPDCARWQLDHLQKQKLAQETLDRLKSTIAAAQEALK